MGQICHAFQKAAQTKQSLQASSRCQRWLTLRQLLHPAEYVGIATQLIGSAYLGEFALQIMQEMSCYGTIMQHRSGTKRSGEAAEFPTKCPPECGVVFH